MAGNEQAVFKLHIIQADYGDCLLLEYGTAADPGYILIDGGPASVYQTHLRQRLQAINAAGAKLDLAVLSHVDEDHIAGLLDFLSELQQQRADGVAEPIAIGALWHNSFAGSLGADVEKRFRTLRQGTALRCALPTNTDLRARSISQGDELTQLPTSLQIPLNPEFATHGLVCVDDAQPAIPLRNLRLSVVGPTQKNLQALRKKWLKWLKEQEMQRTLPAVAYTPEALVKADESVPNLSSIMLLAAAEGKTILLTGDGRGDDLLRGLAQANLLDTNGCLHVNVLKMPHHGSQRNVSKKFLATITADTYIICANGKDDNPDLKTLQWIVETAKAQGRTVELIVTNPTDSTRQLRMLDDPAVYGYQLLEMAPPADLLTVDLVL